MDIHSIAYVIFTSGSTGTPKLVPVTHLNFAACVNALAHSSMIEDNSTVLQTTPVTFDIHIEETLGTLWLGGSICLLRPNGNLDMSYLSSLIQRHQITFLITVPTLLISLVDFMQSSPNDLLLRTLRRLCSIGETLRPQTASQLYAYLSCTARLYGPTECIFTSTYHWITCEDLHFNSLPIGRPLVGYKCCVLDHYFQPVLCGQHTGELFIGGKAVFGGYLHRQDQTDQVLVQLPNEEGIFYRTGDFVRIEPTSRLLFYVGRNDFQVKLRGQRIEVGEIEATIIKVRSDINNCVVIKLNHHNSEHLVAYLQTKARLDADLLREECSKHLPLYMIPSLFVLIDRFPLNPNGKIDRSALPSPHFSSQTTNEGEEPPQTEMERRVASIWCDVLHLDSIRSTTKSFFKLGGHSLLLIRLHQTYQSIFQQSLNIADLFHQTTIQDHLKLLEVHRPIVEPTWHSLNINEGPASFAQTRLYLDERLRFGNRSDTVAIYHIPIVLEIVHGSISLARLHRALQTIVEKHKVLRTRLMFNEEENDLRQEIIETSPFEFILTTVTSDKQLDQIILDEETNSELFDLSEGRVFRCHAIRRSINSTEDLLMSSDTLIFNFHHVAFDGESTDLFFEDLRTAYSTEKSLQASVFDYIDYSQHEKEMNFDEAKTFWKRQLDEFTSSQLPLPYDHLHKERSGRGSTIHFDLSRNVVDRMLTYIEQGEVTLFQVGLASFFTFLFKLTEERDLCVLTVSANRRRIELQKIIGVFVNTLPHRLTIDPHKTFSHLLECVKELVLATIPHAHLPFQDIISGTNATSVQTLFDVETQHQDGLVIDCDTLLRPFGSASTDPESVAKFDLSCSLSHHVPTRSISLSFNASTDLFESTAVERMARRFECLLEQIFSSSTPIPVCEFSLLLPNEVDLVRQLSDGDPLVLPEDLLSIHEQFVSRAKEHPQKLSLILDEQSLNYAERHHASQRVSQHLIDECRVQRGDIVGQCVERSIEMSIGIMGILLSGGSYLALSPDAPIDRLHVLIELTRPRCVLLHSETEHLPFANGVSIPDVISAPNQVSIGESLSNVLVSLEDIAFLIFTSGSTGVPKVVPISHGNFLELMLSYNQLGLNGPETSIVQMSSCSFDEHAQQFFGSFILGATLILLRPVGHLDAEYIYRTIAMNQGTTLDLVPTSLSILCEYLKEKSDSDSFTCLSTLHLITVGGEQLQGKIVKDIFHHLSPNCSLINVYAPAECTISALHYRMTPLDEIPEIIPIGRCFPGRRVAVLDPYGEQIIPDGRSVGEIYLGGVGVFNGYLHQPEESAKVLVRLPGRDGVFYRTNDPGKMNKKGELVFVGRGDFQVKLRGQRIELGEIESVIRRFSSDVNDCVVVKAIDHLVSYIQTRIELNVDLLRDECSKKLPLYMVPSLFILLDGFPLNSNGKVDRKALPAPDFSVLLSSESSMYDEHLRSEMERQLASIWSEILHLERIQSTRTSFFQLGGNSVLLIRLHCLYQRRFEQKINISDLFRRTNIADHVELLARSPVRIESPWESLELSRGSASFAQMRIYLDERVRFVNATYNIPLVYEIAETPLSLSRLQRALDAVIEKHKVLRTRLVFDSTTSELNQEIVEARSSEMVVTRVSEREDLNRILNEEETDGRIFDLNEGRVFRTLVIRRSTNVDVDLLAPFDLLVFNFHHVALDGASIEIFFVDLKRAYLSEKALERDTFDYIDYSEHEKKINFDRDRSFWKEQFKGLNNTLLPLPYDRSPNGKSERSGRGSTETFDLRRDLVERIFALIIDIDVTLFQVGLAAFFTFLFKLTQETDLCVLTVSSNRPRDELQGILGFFTNTLPQRVLIDPQSTFVELVKGVKELALSSLPHAQFPFQEMGMSTDLQTLFLAETLPRGWDVSGFHLVPFEPLNNDRVAKFDLTGSLSHNTEERSISLSFNASSDLFDEGSVSIMARRFECLLEQLFDCPSSSLFDHSLFLPHDVDILRAVNTEKKFPFDPHLRSIPEEFACRAVEHPQKVSVVLDDQSLTYAEVSHNAQLIAKRLIEAFDVRPKDILALFLERSLEMPLAILGTWMC